MGIIKTAMMAGAGMYAVNKLAQTAQNRRPSPQPQSQQQYMDNGNPQQQYYNTPSQTQNGQQQQRVVPMEFSDRRGPQQSNQNQPQYLLTNDANSRVPTYGYNAEGGYYFELDPPSSSAPPAMAYANNRGSPPPPQYENFRGQGQQGFVEPDEVSDSGYGGPSNFRGGNGSGGGSAALLNTLMQHAGDLKDGKGKDFVGKFLK